jgi:putative heme-binding domain-containing protein
LEYVILTIDGRVVTGIVAGQSETAVTIRMADNKSETIVRSDIDEMHNTSRSFMPEGFENTIDPSAMADLMAFLTRPADAEPGGTE